MQERVVYTTAELQVLLGIGRATLYRLLRDGTLPGIRIGRKWMVPRERLGKVLAGVEGESAAPGHAGYARGGWNAAGAAKQRGGRRG